MRLCLSTDVDLAFGFSRTLEFDALRPRSTDYLRTHVGDYLVLFRNDDLYVRTKMDSTNYVFVGPPASFILPIPIS